MKNKKTLSLLALLISFCFYLKIIEVPLAVTETDTVYIQKILAKDFPLQSSLHSFQEECALIESVLKGIHKTIAPYGQAIPYGQPREPKDVYINKGGSCYDMSRLVEKVFRSLGFKVRHVATYRLNGMNKMSALFKSGTISHSTSEILTRKGWMLLDPQTSTLALDPEGNPISIEKIVKEKTVVFPAGTSDQRFDYYQAPLIAVYGLYSRHGKFYPPFNFIPNINWSEFFENFTRD